MVGAINKQYNLDLFINDETRLFYALTEKGRATDIFCPNNKKLIKVFTKLKEIGGIGNLSEINIKNSEYYLKFLKRRGLVKEI